MSSLTFIKKMEKQAVSVKALLHREMAGMEAPRPHFPLRASTLLKKDTEFCPREHAFMDMAIAKPKAQFVGTSQRYTFDHGKDAEKRIRNVYMRKTAVGHWKCRVCKHVDPAFGLCPDPKPCPKCGFKFHWEYVEPEFDHPHTGVQCHIDVLLKMEKPKLHLVELKTMAGDEFKKLMAPLAEHKMRTSLYLQMVAESEWEGKQRVDTSEASILYVSKQFGCKDTTLAEHKIKDAPFSPFKEFIIKRDDTLNARMMARARVLKVWRDTGSNPQAMPGGICKSTMDQRAKQCTACQACYSGKYPATLTWPEDGKPRHQGKQLVI